MGESEHNLWPKFPSLNLEPHGAPRASPWSPKTVPTYAKASVGHPPVSEIRRSLVDPSLTEFASAVTHSSTAKAMVSCVGG